MTEKRSLFSHPVHLGPGATAIVQPEMTGMEWYEAYAELVLCISGEMVIHQEGDDGEASLALGPGDYAINAPGIWHTADIKEKATALFITVGEGTEHRPR